MSDSDAEKFDKKWAEGSQEVQSSGSVSDDLESALKKGRQTSDVDFLKYTATHDKKNAPILTNEPFPIDASLIDFLGKNFYDCQMDIGFEMIEDLMLDRRVCLMGFKREAVNKALDSWVAIQQGKGKKEPKINSLLERE